ncbi:MAG: hypothetical protein H6Q74_1978 [Firmicutes bacterium]|nr:hypothetical protein [Bacillota bacterium]
MLILHLDCLAGLSGNMFLGAMLDLGMPEEKLRLDLAKLAISGYELHINRVIKQGINAVYVNITTYNHQQYKMLSDMYKIIDDAQLNDLVKGLSRKIILKLAQAEAEVRGTTIDNIHFTEVGAVSLIIEIVGAAICLEYMEFERIYISNLRTGIGVMIGRHDIMAVPAPVTVELLRGIPYEHGDIAQELVTPTGAAILAAFSHGNGNVPEDFVIQRIGYGAGTLELDIPNVVKATMGDNHPFIITDELLYMDSGTAQQVGNFSNKIFVSRKNDEFCLNNSIEEH